MPEAQCQACGKTFYYRPRGKSYQARFCSCTCANRSRPAQRELRRCLTCDTEFECSPDSVRRYCSRACAAQRLVKPLPSYQCANCGKTFTPTKNRGPRKYCSRACSDTADKSAPRRLPRIKKKCAYCGKAFNCAPYHETECCSRLCSNRLTAKKQVGANHHLYKDKVRKVCEVCGKVCYVKPSVADRFRSCSRQCNAYLAKMSMPRVSSLETKMIDALERHGFHPVGQYGIPPFVVDIAFPDASLVIECDGAYWHRTPAQKAKDNGKTKFLEHRGWKVVRLTEAAIKDDIAGCVAEVARLLSGQISQGGNL